MTKFTIQSKEDKNVILRGIMYNSKTHTDPITGVSPYGVTFSYFTHMHSIEGIASESEAKKAIKFLFREEDGFEVVYS